MSIKFNGVDKTLSVLTALASQQTTEKMQAAAADSYVTDTLDYIAHGKSFAPHTGTLQRSIGWRKNGTETVIEATAFYAQYVEFGHPSVLKTKNSHATKAYPFLFADQQNREQNMRTAALSVLTAIAKTA